MIRPPTRKVPICTACYLRTPEHAEKLRGRYTYQASMNSNLETIPWNATAQTRQCWLCGHPTESGLTVDGNGRKRRYRHPFRSLARLRLRHGAA